MTSYTNGTTSHTISSSRSDKSNACSNNMRLFGLPYQFTETVDPRYAEVSSTVGKNFVESVIMDAPVLTIIPGKAVFLPGEDSGTRASLGSAFLQAADGDSNVLSNILNSKGSSDPSEKLRFYDFEESYTEYMKYVNIMCRTVATFLKLGERIQTGQKGMISLQNYDWRNYRWNDLQYTSNAIGLTRSSFSSAVNSILNAPATIYNTFRGNPTAMSYDTNGGDGKGEIGTTHNFLQFYVDPSSGSSQTMQNSAEPSSIKSMLDTVGSRAKDLAWMADTMGANGTDLTASAADFVSNLGTGVVDKLSDENSAFGKNLKQIITAGTGVIKGENVILPDIYKSSEYGIDYTVDIHLRAPYGNKYSVYMDVIVPMLHLIGLVIPRQATTNTYGSPFLVKAYYPGCFNCNLGIVESLQITRPSSDDAWSNDGLPTEVDVQLRIKDLYSDLSMSPSNDPGLFRNNTSLVDYLATVSGLSLIEPQLSTKMSMILNSYSNAVMDIDDNIKSAVLDTWERKLSGFISLT